MIQVSGQTESPECSGCESQMGIAVSSCLQYSCSGRQQSPRVIRILIKEGCIDVNIRTDNAKRLTPLHVAAQSNAEGALKHLLAKRGSAR